MDLGGMSVTRSRDAALGDLVRDRGEALVRYGYLLTGDLASAQDLVQDAVVKVFVRVGRGRAPDFLEAYVRRTMATLAIDRHRGRRRRQRTEQLLADPSPVVDPEASTATRLDLAEALAQLGRQERTAVVLRFYDDLTVPQIASRMGLAEGSVKRYLANAMQRLERNLGPIDDPPRDDVVVKLSASRRKG